MLNISQNNADGFAEINLGGSNKITLHDRPISSIEPVHFRIIPKIDNYIIGTNEKDNLLVNNLFKENDNLKGTDQNDYIKGRVDTLDRTDTGFDILDGGAGDDVFCFFFELDVQTPKQNTTQETHVRNTSRTH